MRFTSQNIGEKKMRIAAKVFKHLKNHFCWEFHSLQSKNGKSHYLHRSGFFF